MSTIVAPSEPLPIQSNDRSSGGFWRTEDWLAVLIGVGIVLVALALFLSGASLKWIAIIPVRWTSTSELQNHFSMHWQQYVAQYVMFAVLFGAGAGLLGINFANFLKSFTFVYAIAVLIFVIGQWDRASYYNLEPPIVALLLGLVLANVIGLPQWMDAGFRVEFFVKVGIILLGATLPFTLIAWAGPVAIVQAGIVSVVTFGVRPVALARSSCHHAHCAVPARDLSCKEPWSSR